jgi:hypothetical protein
MGDTPQSMRAVQSSLREEIVAQRQEDEAAHAVILGKLHDFETEFRVRNARDEEKLASGTSIKKQLFALIILFLSILTGLVSWFTLEIRETQEHVHQIELEEKSNAREGFAIARSIQKEVNALQLAVQECQRRHGIRSNKE